MENKSGQFKIDYTKLEKASYKQVDAQISQVKTATKNSKQTIQEASDGVQRQRELKYGEHISTLFRNSNSLMLYI